MTETYAPEINGVALTLSRLVDGLGRRGHRVSVVRPRQRALDSGRPDERGVTTVGGVPLPFYRGLQLGLPASRTLQRRWTSDPPNVVYIATEGPLGWSAVRETRRLGIPACSGFHTNFHDYSRFYVPGCFTRVVLRYLRWFHNSTDGAIVASAELRDRLQAAGVRTKGVLGRGVDAELFNPARRCASLRRQWGATDGTVVVLCVGRIAREKNLQLAAEAYRAMEWTGRKMKFVIVGDGPARAQLEQENADFIFTGVLTGHELARHYASADLFLFPSETETFGNVTLEAMASGLPVVAYDYAAAHVHIKDRQTGFLAPVGDTRRFITAAVEAADRAGSLDQMRCDARRSAEAADWPTVVDRFAALLLGPHRREDCGQPRPLMEMC